VSPSELAREIASGRFAPVYYLHGSEDYRIKEAEKAIIQNFLPKSLQGTNHNSFSAQKRRIDDILMELSVFPMMGERQVFTISDIQSLSVSDIERILALLNPPDPNRIIILTTPSAKMPRRQTKVISLLIQNTQAVEFDRLTRKAAKAKIQSLFDAKNVKIDANALEALLELGGGDLGGLVAEVSKLADYVGSGGVVSLEDIDVLSSDYRSFRVFELAYHAAHGDADRALNVIEFLVSRGERLSTLLFWLGEHFIGLYLAKNKKPFGRGAADQSWKYRDQLNLFDNIQLEGIIDLISKADFDLRNNIEPEKLILEQLVLRICALSKKAANVGKI
jgi:DNA polymerase-3 subunit delta